MACDLLNHSHYRLRYGLRYGLRKAMRFGKPDLSDFIPHVGRHQRDGYDRE
jgi:hypothetical protein